VQPQQIQPSPARYRKGWLRNASTFKGRQSQFEDVADISVFKLWNLIKIQISKERAQRQQVRYPPATLEALRTEVDILLIPIVVQKLDSNFNRVGTLLPNPIRFLFSYGD
jgi:hypothetical protein